MIGERIREIRKSKGITQEKLAKAAGVSQQIIAHLEAGNQHNTTKLVAIARGLGVSAVEIDPAYYGAPNQRPTGETCPQEDTWFSTFLSGRTPEEIARIKVTLLTAFPAK